MPYTFRKVYLISPVVLLQLMGGGGVALAQQTVELDEVVVSTAGEALLQAAGSTVITQEALEKYPVSNDISELVRKMPGVNLTGATASGQYGNKRQIDLRGMGPENTLILIDGVPVTSRNVTRMGRGGERNTRGDSNWVPVEAIDKIEVIRGPAAVRYGSGAMGGVVNIITKGTSDRLTGSVSYYTNIPEDSQDGGSSRLGFNVSAPIIEDKLSFRIYGSINKTDSDATFINGGNDNTAIRAGREGVRNKDIAGRLHWNLTPNQSLIFNASYSRQGDIYNGDMQNSIAPRPNLNFAEIRNDLVGQETSRLYRTSFGLTYRGEFEWGKWRNDLSYEQTRNSRLPEFLSGGPEGGYSSTTGMVESAMKVYRFKTEADIPFQAWITEQNLTLGAEANYSSLDNPHAMTQQLRTNETIPNYPEGNRSGKTSLTEYALFIEDNIYFPASGTALIPTLRFDYSNTYGSNLSPGLNMYQEIGPYFTLKAGIARAYKTPNLYQGNANYLTSSNGNGCPVGTSGGCYLIGSDDLKPETSINKELGVEFNYADYQATLTYFHNNYRNKITAGTDVYAISNIGRNVYQWQNADRAVVEGFEGSLNVPVLDNLDWYTNFTYMRRSINKTTGNPLSLIPKYTINTSLDWQINDSWDAILSYTYYGKQEAPRNATQVDPYGIMGLSVGYQWDKTFDLRLGVNNLFDKRLLRTGKGAQTYNEPGRAYYATFRVSF